MKFSKKFRNKQKIIKVCYVISIWAHESKRVTSTTSKYIKREYSDSFERYHNSRERRPENCGKNIFFFFSQNEKSHSQVWEENKRNFIFRRTIWTWHTFLYWITQYFDDALLSHEPKCAAFHSFYSFLFIYRVLIKSSSTSSHDVKFSSSLHLFHVSSFSSSWCMATHCDIYFCHRFGECYSH